MELDIQNQNESPLLMRKRITAMATFEKKKTPTKIEMASEIAKKIKVDKKLVVVKHIYQKFGSNKAKIISHVYENEDMAKKLENDSLILKHLTKEEQEALKKAEEEKKVAKAAAKTE